jgi:hypothetical protein
VTPGLKAVAAGYEAFGVGRPSDHRVLWANFTYEDAFGVSGTPLVLPGVRRLNTKNPQLVEKYVQQLRHQLVYSGLAKRSLRPGDMCQTTRLVGRSSSGI